MIQQSILILTIVSINIISHSGRTKIVMKKVLGAQGNALSNIRQLLSTVNILAKPSDQWSYIIGSYNANVSTEQWVAWLKERK